jgi:hypothetical protein
MQICGLEFWGRLTNMDPFFPYELTKYLMFLYLIIFLVFRNQKNNKTAFILTIIILGYSIVMVLNNVKISRVFSDSNGLLILLLGLTLFRSSNLTITKQQITMLTKRWLYYLMLGVVFIFIKSPRIENMGLSLGANYDATGGESANQVSTYLGFGAFLIAYSLITKRYFSGKRIIDLVILTIFILQSLLTFSRGGVIVAILLILYLLYVLEFISLSLNRILLVVVLSTFVFGAFIFLNNKTNGLLLSRYQGETNATLIGKKEKTINVITSNRTQIIEENFEIFKQNFFGVGPSQGTVKRIELFGSNYYDHTEPSRWLVEYGVFGIILFIGYLVLMFKYIKFDFSDNGARPYKAFLAAMILFSSLTMMHSATRTFVSFLPMVVGFINLTSNGTTSHSRNKTLQAT